MPSNIVVTVKLSKVKEDVMRRRLKNMGLDATGTKKELVYQLVKDTEEKIAKNVIPKGKAVQCDVCGGYSDLRNPECPYCGTIDEESLDKNNAPQDNVVLIKPTTKSSTAKKPAAKKKKRSEVVLGKAKKPTPKTNAETKAKTKVVKAEVYDNVKVATSEVLSKKHTENDLNESIGRIDAAKAKAGEGLYEYGRELALINKGELWKLRSSQQYKSFEAFCRDEVKISRQHAYRLMAVSTRYTEEQFTKFGISKCSIALTVPEEVRDKLLGDGSASKNELSERAKKLIDGEERARKTPPVSDEEKRVTVAVMPGIIEMPMQKRPSQDDWPIGKLTEPATSIADDPWCRLGLTNNLFLSVRLTRNEQGHWIAIIEFRRAEETA